MEVRTEIIKATFAADVALHVQTFVNGDEQNAAFILPAFHNLTSDTVDVMVALATECKITQPTNIDIDFNLPLSLEEDRSSTLELHSNAKTISSESADAIMREHLQHCTVGISVEGMGNLSGIFIGPKQVLTSHDIVNYVQDRNHTVTVKWDGKSYPVQFIVDMPNLDALLLYVNIEDHPCLSLNAVAEYSGNLYSSHYSEDFTGITIYQYKGMAQQNHYPSIVLRSEQTKRGGMSGAPLLNISTGQVCGMVMDEGANQWGIPIHIILEELSKRSYSLPQPKDASRYTQQQFEREIMTYAMHEEKLLHNLKLSGLVPHTSPNTLNYELENIYVQPLLDVDGIITTIADLLDTHLNTVVLGGPGSGKTMLVRYLAWSHTQAYSQASSTSPPPLQEKSIPLRIELRRYAEERRMHNYDFLSFVDEILLKREGVNIDRRMFEQLLERRLMLLLFDGLDEVATLEERLRFVNEIEQFTIRYPGNRVLITSRSVGYDLARFSNITFVHAQLLPFDEEQINQYLANWYVHALRLSPLPREEQQELDSLIKVLRANTRLRNLAENPLLLTFIAQLHRYERLPDRRVLIYDRIAELMLETWSKIKGTDARWNDIKLGREDQYACIAHLGFFMHLLSQPEPQENVQDLDKVVGGTTARMMMREIERFIKDRHLITAIAERSVEARRFIDLIQVETGLIIEQGTDENGEPLYGFVQRTFQEYFAAADVYERYQQEEDPHIIRSFLRENLYDPYWSEVIFLLFGKLKRRPLTILLQEILSGVIRSRHRLHDDDVLNDILFVCSCLREELAVDDSLAEEVVGVLGNLAMNATSVSPYEQIMKMLSAIAKTRVYGELGRKKIEEIELRKRQEQLQDMAPSPQQLVPIYRYYVYLTIPARTAQIGQTLSLTLHIQSTQRDNSKPLLLPVNALELGVYLEAPGFYLEGDHLRSLLVVDGRPADTTLQIQCKPVLSGEQVLRILLYPGGQTRELTPTILTQSITILAPIVLPPIPELLDQRTIPNPYPDIVLVIALEDLRDTQRLQVYCSCPALRMERASLGPLPLSLADIACMRQTVIHYASALCSLAPDEVQKNLQQLGATLFDQLMPPDHKLRATYWKLHDLAINSPTPLSWLIIADESALLPWELVCPYEKKATTDEIDFDDFLADSFALSHWVARQGLPIKAEAPLGWLALDHYQQYPHHLPQWHSVLADETLDEAEQPVEGYLALQQPGLPYYGLHVLRYHDPDRGTRITTLERQPGEAMPSRSDAERMTYERRLDFTRKRPVIGLSLVEEATLQLDTRVSQRDTQLEAGWILPFMHAGASALVGARWSVLPEVDQLFFRAFYQSIRSGTQLGWAVGAARAQVKHAFPWRSDWLAYTYFGHPWCSLYQVEPSQGYTLFEVLHHPDETPLACGETYQFLASYRSEAPLWYDGRLQMQRTVLQGEDISVAVIPLNGGEIQTYPLTQVQAGNDYQRIVTLTMPAEQTTYPVLVSFQRGKKELQTLVLNLNVVE